MTSSKCDGCGERYDLSGAHTNVSVAFNDQPRDNIAMELCPDCGLMLLRDVRSAHEANQDPRWASP